MALIGNKSGVFVALFLSAFLILIHPGFLFAQPYLKNLHSNLFLKNYSVKDGLSESNVNAIYRDSNGIVWIGTDGGLNRFNSFEFTVFKNDSSDHSLSDNRVYDIIEDDFGRIWIGTSNGLNAFVPEISGFQRFFFTDFDRIRDLHYDSDSKNLYIADDTKGLIRFNVENQTHEKIDVFPRGVRVQKILEIGEDSLAIGTQENGLFLLNTLNFSTRHIHKTSAPVSLEDNTVLALACTKDYLVAGTSKGLHLLDLERREVKVLSKTRENFTSDLIINTTVNKDGKLWVGTDGGGINVVNLADLSFKNYKADLPNGNHLQSNVIREIHIDQSDNIWIGTYKRGFGVYNEKSRYLENVYLDESVLPDYGNSSVTSFAMDKDHSLILGVDGSGVIKWDGTKFEAIPLTHKPDDNHNQKVVSVYYDDLNNLWTGTFAEGLFLLRENGEKIHFTNANTNNLFGNSIWQIRKDPTSGLLWLATDNGLTSVDPITYEFQTYFPVNDIDPAASRELRTLTISSSGEIWVGGGLGAFRFDPKEKEFTGKYSSYDPSNPLRGNIVISFLELDSNHIAFGLYGQGVQILDLKSNRFVDYKIMDYLSNKVINFMAKGPNGSVWVGTNSGIATVDLTNDVLNWYNSNNGLNDDVYNIGASLMLNDTILFAGGNSGFTILDTRKLGDRWNNPKLVLEKINYKESNLSFNPYSLKGVPQFEIPYSKGSLHIIFAAIDYFNSENIRFSYILENFNQNWSERSTYRQASYANLPPGTYHFKVRSYTFSNLINDPVTLATFTVYPTWWMTIWFRFFLGLIGVLLILAFIRIRTGQHRKAQRRLTRAVKEKTSQIARQKKELVDINQQLEDIVKRRTKELNITINELNKTINELDRFVYSASHDLGAPLKSILGLINIAQLETHDKKIGPHLTLMKNSVLRLEDVISSLIQYSRNNRLDLQVEEINLHDLVEDCYDSLRFMNGYESIKFKNAVPKKIAVLSDESRLKVVLRNLLSNSVKYADHTKEKQRIKVSYIAFEDGNWQLSVEDNGIGIDHQHHKNIFEMFYRASEASDGSGLGLYITKEAIVKLDGRVTVDSEVGKGTIISVFFSKPKAAPVIINKIKKNKPETKDS